MAKGKRKQDKVSGKSCKNKRGMSLEKEVQQAEPLPQAKNASAPAASSPPSAAGDLVRGPRKVSVAICAGGMFLTLVLGLYLGTLLPGIVSAPERQAPRQEAEAPGPVPAAPDQAPGEIDPQLKRMLADQEKRAAANPDSAPDWINLGNAYFDAGMPRQAIKAYERALALAPRNADVLTDLGIMYRETGDFNKALETFRKATDVDPAHQNAIFNEGVVLSSDLHRNAEAAAAWRRLLEINPGAKAPNGAPLGDMIRQLH